MEQAVHIGCLEDSGTLGLPAAFFTQGWHLVLTPAEVGVLLMARHAVRPHSGSMDAPGVPITRMKRWQVYGISGEAYSAIHELQEFGLLTVHDTMPNRRRGKVRTPLPEERAAVEEAGESLAPVPYHLAPRGDSVFYRPALATVHASLLDYPAPPRV
jgi:hypothetical protein